MTMALCCCTGAEVTRCGWTGGTDLLVKRGEVLADGCVGGPEVETFEHFLQECDGLRGVPLAAWVSCCCLGWSHLG